MYELKRPSQLRRFFKHNSYTEEAMDDLILWLEKVNVNFKDEDDFNKRVPRLIEKFLLSELDKGNATSPVAYAYFGMKNHKDGYRALIEKDREEKKKKWWDQNHPKTTEKQKPTKKAEETAKPETPKKKVSGTEKLYQNGNVEIYKTTIDNDPTIMILLKRYSTDSLLKSLLSEMVESFFSFF